MKKLTLISLLIGALGLAGLAYGSYIYLKAILGQQLIQMAWAKSQDSEQPHKPWPWADTWPLATLKVPALDIEQVVLAGDSGQALAFGPGHRTGSALPGQPGTTLISGHRDTHFRFMGQLHHGDELALVTTDGLRHSYQVVDTLVVPADFQLPSTQEHRLVLATCWPLGTSLQRAKERYLVFAVPSPAVEDQTPQTAPANPRMLSALPRAETSNR